MAGTTIAVTGATGQIGGQVARALAERGVEQRLIVRDPSRAPQLTGASVATAAFDQPAAARAALEGIDVVLMVSATEAPNRVQQHAAFVDAAVAAGVRHVVYTSFYGAAADATFTFARDHWATEGHIAASGLAYTFLRDNFYLDGLTVIGGDEGVIRGPAGDGVVSAIARADVARTATTVLTDVLADAGSHHDVTYDLTGREALTMAEAAAILTEVTGKPIRFENETIEQAYASREIYHAPKWEVDAWVSNYVAIAVGEMAGISDAVETITGRPPMTLRELLADQSG